MKYFSRVLLIACLLLVCGELLSWLLVARHELEGSAWVALVAASLADSEGGRFPRCVSVAPELHDRTSAHDRGRIAGILEKHGVELRVAPPTHNPPTGYLDRECVEIFSAPEEFKGHHLPFLAKPHIAYYTYDFNGDAVLMLQVGTRWIYITSWNLWM